MDDPCKGCLHYDCCTYFDKDEYDKIEEQRFVDNCCGCPCGDGLECSFTQRSIYGSCDNFEVENDR